MRAETRSVWGAKVSPFVNWLVQVCSPLRNFLLNFLVRLPGVQVR
jgi:hypothetical protein